MLEIMLNPTTDLIKYCKISGVTRLLHLERKDGESV